MIIGVGLDILYLPRLIALVKRRGVNGLARRILTQDEVDAFEATADVDGAQGAMVRYLAVRWTAKEAAYKALHAHRETTWKDVEIVKREQTGTRPLLQWTDPSPADAAVKLHLSVSHDGEYVASTVIAESLQAIRQFQA